MTDTLELAHGSLRCEILPALGGCIAGLWHGALPVLRSTPGAQLHSVRDAGSYPLVPFSNRVAQASLHWEGTDHPLVRNYLPSPHAIHGVAWQRTWQVLEAESDYALLSLEHPGDGSWPFAFDCTQAFRLHADALDLTLSVTNHAAQAAPMGLGWHPYFVKRAQSRVQFEATGRWEMDELSLPIRRSPTQGLDQACAGLQIDDCFDGWKGTVRMEDEHLRVRLTADLRCLVVYTLPTQAFFAVEPVSHVNNAINMAAGQGANALKALGVQVLPPGGTMTAQMRIAVEPR